MISGSINVFVFFNVFLSLFLREKETEHTHVFTRGGWAERERERERIPSRLPTVSTELDTRLELMNHEIITWAEIKSRTLNQWSHPGVPY